MTEITRTTRLLAEPCRYCGEPTVQRQFHGYWWPRNTDLTRHECAAYSEEMWNGQTTTPSHSVA